MKAVKKLHATKADTTDAVDEFLASLDHPLKKELLVARRTILSVSSEIQEGVKWNAPSFRTSEYFATTNLRASEEIQFIFHLGAKVRANPIKVELPDPAKLAKWLAKDRCLVALGSGAIFKARQPAFADFVRAWIRYV